MREVGIDNFKLSTIKSFNKIYASELKAEEHKSIVEFDTVENGYNMYYGDSHCEHNRVRSRCKDCGGASICEHNRQRSTCKECGGSQICEHNRVRSQCKECGGSQICEHNKRRSRCKECGGSSICEHNRERCKCKECNPNDFWCIICNKQYAGNSALKKHQEKYHTPKPQE